jgi:hypothetical protein
VRPEAAEGAQRAPDWPKVLLAMEGAALLAVALFAYSRLGGDWGRFALLFLAPDIAIIFYFAGPRIGAIVYNCAHVTFVPLALATFGLLSGKPIVAQLALIHLAHIGLDRALGFGLKYPTAFGDTHLGRADMALWRRR